jgi:hypothetical protein
MSFCFLSMMDMVSSKKEVQDLLKNLPEDSSMDDIIDAIYVRQKIMKGLHDSEKGNVFSQEEAKEIIEKWLK